MIYLHKLIPLLVSPLFVFLVLLLLGKFLHARRLTITAVLLLLIASNPLIAAQATAYLEKDYPARAMKTLPPADAVVVLSGMVNVIEVGPNIYKYEYRGSVDRLFAGVDIANTQDIRKLILTRGQMPWSVGEPEGETLKRRAVSMGVPADIIKLTPPVENTEDEAKAVSAMLEAEGSSIILITSAFHMPRALRLFEAAGLAVTPFPVDFHATAGRVTVMDFIPSASALSDTSDFCREMLGRLFYALKYSAA